MANGGLVSDSRLMFKLGLMRDGSLQMPGLASSILHLSTFHGKTIDWPCGKRLLTRLSSWVSMGARLDQLEYSK